MTHLKRDVGAFQFFTFAFGAVVGVGWAVVLGDWLRQAGPLGAMLGLAAGGAIIVLIGLCYGEIAALIPSSGGEMAFAYDVFGERAGYLVGWLLAFTYIVVGAYEAISIGWILSALVPGIEGPVLYSSLGTDVRAGSLLCGLGGMAILTWVNVRGIKASGQTQNALVVILLVLATLFIGLGIVRGDAGNLQPWFQRSASGSIWPGVLALFMTASFWFGGFNVVPVMMEEKASGTSFRRVGLMIALAIVIGIVFKTSVILSAAMTTPWQQLMEMEIPVATAFERAFGSVVLGKVVLFTALLGLLSTWNAMFVCGSRLLFALGRSHLIHPAMGRVHGTYGSPAAAIIFTGLVGGSVTLLGRNAILPIVNAASSCLALSYLITCVAVMRLRRTRPDVERPFRVPGGKATMAVAIVGSAFSFGLALYQPWADAKGRLPLEWAMLAGWLVLGAAAWGAASRIRGSVGADARRRIALGVADT